MFENISRFHRSLVAQALKNFLNLNLRGVGGNRFDDIIGAHLSQETGFRYVPPGDFAAFMPAHKRHTRNLCRNGTSGYQWMFNELDDVVCEPLIISQPNGSQESPDLLILCEKQAIPIEFKSSKNGSATWNSGLPKAGTVYLFNQYHGKNAGQTFFMGEDVISEEENSVLKSCREEMVMVAEKYNEILIGSPWKMYARPMHCHSDKPLLNPHRQAREQNVIRNLLFDGFVQPKTH